jgi:xylan 1,4-beta-xylosidase
MKKASALVNIAILGCLSGCAMPAFTQQPAEAPKAELRPITVDASSDLGQFKSLRGINSGPLPWTDRLGADRPGGDVEVSDRTGFRSLGADASEGYRRANIDLIRIHDNYGPGDIYANFKGSHEMADGTIIPDSPRNALTMFPDLQADPATAGSYNFGPTDRLVKSIDDVGAHPLFRLGASAGESSGVPDSFTTDGDYDHYAQIARHVVLHYNKGWDNGFRYGVKYWEVLNEPDGRFTPSKYYKLYEKVAHAVKAADPGALIGGPALMFTYQGPTYREDFLEYLRKNHLPLDFWSFHDYSVDSADPYCFVRISMDMRKLLDTYGFIKSQLILDEWNVLGVNPELLSMAARAAFTTSAIIYMQDSPLDAQTFYMGPNLFGDDGKTPNKVGQALIALGRMKRTPVRLAVTGADTQGLAVQAGRSTDGMEINVLISNYEVPDSLRGARSGGDKVAGYLNLLPRRELKYQQNGGFDLKVSRLKPDQLYRIERYRINDVWDYRLLNTVTLKGSEVAITGVLPPPGVELIVIKPAAQ